MYIYIALILIQLLFVLLLRQRHIKSDIIEALLPLFVMFFLAAFRSENVGNDSKNYIEIFEISQREGGLDSLAGRFEKGYLLFNKIVAFISINKYSIFVTSCILIYFISWLMINKMSDLKWLSVFLFLTLGLYSNSINVIRIAMAYSFCMLAYRKLRLGRKIGFVCYVILAFLFHTSALVFLVTPMFDTLRMNKKLFAIWLLATGAAFVLFDLALRIVVKSRPFYMTYINSGEYSNSGYLALSFNILLWIFIVLVIYYLYINNKLPRSATRDIMGKSFYWEKICIYSLLLISIYICGFKFNLLDRVAGYFRCMMIFFIPNAMKELKGSTTKTFVMIGLVILMIGFFFVPLIFRPEWTGIYPYYFSF